MGCLAESSLVLCTWGDPCINILTDLRGSPKFCPPYRGKAAASTDGLSLLIESLGFGPKLPILGRE